MPASPCAAPRYAFPCHENSSPHLDANAGPAASAEAAPAVTTSVATRHSAFPSGCAPAAAEADSSAWM